jgi:hypothetical protein
MKRLLIILLMTFIGILTGRQLDAITLYSTFGPGDTFDSSIGYQFGGPGTRQQIGAPFIPAINSTLDSIDFAASINIGVKNQMTL